MGWEPNPKPQHVQKQLFVNMTLEEEQIFNLLVNKMSLDALALKAKLPISKVATILFQLEMKACVSPLTGKQFERC
jgi:DNA processing protein